MSAIAKQFRSGDKSVRNLETGRTGEALIRREPTRRYKHGW